MMIDVWGADHGGYVKRMQAAVKALTDGAGALDVKLCQLVNLLDGGEPVRMSKRAGTFVTLRDVVDEVGRDVVRFIMLTRKNDAPLDFDFEKVTEQSRDNPVFYVQYAHARCRSVLRHAQANWAIRRSPTRRWPRASLARLTDSAELDLIKQMAGWPRLVEGAAEAHEPHRIAFYLQDVAQAFHRPVDKGQGRTRNCASSMLDGHAAHGGAAGAGPGHAGRGRLGPRGDRRRAGRGVAVMAGDAGAVRQH